MSKRTRHATSSVKNRTWWNELRRQKNVALDEIGQRTGYSPSQASHFFSGRIMPTDEFIEKVCEIFDVEFYEGKLHFTAAYNSRRTQFETVAKEKADDDLLRSIYGIVDYDTFIAIRSAAPGSAQNALAQLYGKISLSDFLKLKEALGNDGGAGNE